MHSMRKMMKETYCRVCFMRKASGEALTTVQQQQTKKRINYFNQPLRGKGDMGELTRMIYFFPFFLVFLFIIIVVSRVTVAKVVIRG